MFDFGRVNVAVINVMRSKVWGIVDFLIYTNLVLFFELGYISVADTVLFMLVYYLIYDNINIRYDIDIITNEMKGGE